MGIAGRVFGDILEVSVDSPELDMHELIRAGSAMLSNPEVKPGMKLLLIVMPATGVLLSSQAFQLMEKARNVLEKYFKKTAGVAYTEVHFGLMRVVFNSARSYGLVTGVFRNRGDAVRWLIK